MKLGKPGNARLNSSLPPRQPSVNVNPRHRPPLHNVSAKHLTSQQQPRKRPVLATPFSIIHQTFSHFAGSVATPTSSSPASGCPLSSLHPVANRGLGPSLLRPFFYFPTRPPLTRIGATYSLSEPIQSPIRPDVSHSHAPGDHNYSGRLHSIIKPCIRRAHTGRSR